MELKIKAVRTVHMRNDEYFLFYTSVGNLINKYGAAALKIEAQYVEIVPLFEDVDSALKKITMSAITLEIKKADKISDSIFRGMTDGYKAALNSSNAQKVEAANRLKPVFVTYGNLAAKPTKEQPAGIINMLQELTGKYAADCQTIGITEQVAALAESNNRVIELMGNRIFETSIRSNVVLKEARQKLDAAYRKIVERINALVVVEGPANYEAFINELNADIDKYNNTIAQRAGIAAAKK